MIFRSMLLFTVLLLVYEANSSIQYTSIIYDGHAYQIQMIHKIRYFESKHLAAEVYLQDVVNAFLSKHGDNVISVLPVMESALLVHYRE